MPRRGCAASPTGIEHKELTMTENTFTTTGNMTADPTVLERSSGVIVKFAIATNGRRYDRRQERFVDRRPVYKNVVVFRPRLAANVAASLKGGTTVTVTGIEVDDSWTPEGSGQLRVRTVIEAIDVSTSLQNATVEVIRNPRAPQAEPLGASN
jgi:single-stranded DNA-binding protein